MSPESTKQHSAIKKAVLAGDDLAALLTAVSRSGYRLIGPTVRDNAIVFGEISGIADLPEGYSDAQEKGSYRLGHSKDKKLFNYVVGPQNLRCLMTPTTRVVLEAERDGHHMKITPPAEDGTPLAVLGVRSCEVAALAMQDRAMLAAPYADTLYARRRESMLLIAVNCTRPGGTCFCASLGTGPRAEAGFDLALTELGKASQPIYVVTVGSERGAELLAAERKALDKAASSMGRSLNPAGLRDTLDQRFDSPHWDRISERCLTCGNCTMVCPTCFCSTIEDTTDLGGTHAMRHRRWDTCFSQEFSYIHGGSVRSSETSRYRQWMMHKLCYWLDQFGTLGCVGCGRCITWCPVGIDITEEARAFQEMK